MVHRILSASLLIIRSALWILLLGLLAACGGDDYHYPSVQLEYLSATTGSDGTLRSVTTDEGVTYPVLNDRSGLCSTPDSLLRIVSNYLLVDEGQGVELYAVRQAIAPLPKPLSEFKDGVRTDGVELLSAWRVPSYLNLVVTVLQQSATHYFHFIEEEVTTDPSTGIRRVSLLLYHDASGDVQAYSRRVYLSVPLEHYLEPGITGVELSFAYTDYEGRRVQIEGI